MSVCRAALAYRGRARIGEGGRAVVVPPLDPPPSPDAAYVCATLRVPSPHGVHVHALVSADGAIELQCLGDDPAACAGLEADWLLVVDPPAPPAAPAPVCPAAPAAAPAADALPSLSKLLFRREVLRHGRSDPPGGDDFTIAGRGTAKEVL